MEQWFGQEYEEFNNRVLVNEEKINEAIGKLWQEVGCPACTLAALRQKGIPPRWTCFDFEKECHDFWGDANERDMIGVW